MAGIGATLPAPRLAADFAIVAGAFA